MCDEVINLSIGRRVGVFQIGSECSAANKYRSKPMVELFMWWVFFQPLLLWLLLSNSKVIIQRHINYPKFLLLLRVFLIRKNTRMRPHSTIKFLIGVHSICNNKPTDGDVFALKSERKRMGERERESARGQESDMAKVE